MTAAASDHHVARPTFLSVSEPSAESVLPALVEADIGTAAHINPVLGRLPRATRSVRGLPYPAAAGWALVMAGT